MKLWGRNLKRTVSFVGGSFAGGLGDDGEGVEARLKLIVEEVIDHTVSFNETVSLELGGYDLDVEMGLLVVGGFPHGGVTRVLVRHVVHLQHRGLQRRLQLRLYSVRPR